MTIFYILIAGLPGIIIGAGFGFWIRKRIIERQFESINNYSNKIINDAHGKAKTIKKEAMLRAKDTIYQMKLDFEKETKEKKASFKPWKGDCSIKRKPLTKRSVSTKAGRTFCLNVRKISVRQKRICRKNRQSMMKCLQNNVINSNH